MRRSNLGENIIAGLIVLCFAGLIILGIGVVVDFLMAPLYALL